MNRAHPYHFVLKYDWLRLPGIEIELAINHCQSFWRRVLSESFAESTVTVPGSSSVNQPGLLRTSTGTKKKKLAVCSRLPAGEMDEPSEQMRPLLRAVSTRPTQLTVGPVFSLPGSLSMFAPRSPRQPREYGGDAWESDSERHHPAPAIVSRLLLLTRGTGTSCVRMSR